MISAGFLAGSAMKPYIPQNISKVKGTVSNLKSVKSKDLTALVYESEEITMYKQLKNIYIEKTDERTVVLHKCFEVEGYLPVKNFTNKPIEFEIEVLEKAYRDIVLYDGYDCSSTGMAGLFNSDICWNPLVVDG